MGESGWQVDLSRRVIGIFCESRGYYGYRKITASLRNGGFALNHKMVYRIMWGGGHKCLLRPRKYGKQPTDPDAVTFKGLPGMLADSLPDTYGRTLFYRLLAMTGRTSGNAVETLCYMGKRCMGAL